MPSSFAVGRAASIARADDGRHVERLQFDIELPGDDPRDVQEIFDEALLSPCVPIDRGDRPLHRRPFHGAGAQHLRPAEHGVQRCAQLVRQDGEELVLQDVRALGGSRRGAIARLALAERVVGLRAFRELPVDDERDEDQQADRRDAAQDLGVHGTPKPRGGLQAALRE